MIQTANNNLSVLPWYTSLEEQNHHKSYAFGQIYPLISPTDRLLPFQIMRTNGSNNNLSHCKIYDINGKEVADITAAILETGFYIKKFTDFDILINVGLLPLGIRLLEGMYYAEISDGIQTWYSEVFTVLRDMSRCIKLEWWDDEDLKFDAGAIAYTAPKFKNILYVQSELGKPEYSFEEEGETRDGYFFPELQISEKTYKFTFIAPEYLCDVLRLVRLSDHKIITDKYGHIYDCDTLSFEVEWQEQGDLAAINAEFQTATVVKKIGKGVMLGVGGDFDNDFNKSFASIPTNLPQNLLTIHSLSTTVTSEYPVASDINIYMKFVDIDGEDYGKVEKIYTMPVGSTKIDYQEYEENLEEYRIEGRGYDAEYIYAITLIRD